MMEGLLDARVIFCGEKIERALINNEPVLIIGETLLSELLFHYLQIAYGLEKKGIALFFGEQIKVLKLNPKQQVKTPDTWKHVYFENIVDILANQKTWEHEHLIHEI